MFGIVITAFLIWFTIRIVIFESLGYLYNRGVLVEIKSKLDSFNKVRSFERFSYWESEKLSYSIMVDNRTGDISIYEILDIWGSSRCVVADDIKSSWIVYYLHCRPIVKYVKP